MDSTSTTTTPTPRDVATAAAQPLTEIHREAVDTSRLPEVPAEPDSTPLDDVDVTPPHLVAADHTETILDLVGEAAYRYSKPVVTISLADLPRERQREVFAELLRRKDGRVILPMDGGRLATLGFSRMSQILVKFAVDAVAHKQSYAATRVGWALDSELKASS